jgi:hypothetical protein
MTMTTNEPELAGTVSVTNGGTVITGDDIVIVDGNTVVADEPAMPCQGLSIGEM